MSQGQTDTSSTKKLNWNPYWRDAARSIKRAVLSRGDVELAGATFRIAYEARNRERTADYEFLAAAARGTRCVFDVGANVGLTALVMGSNMAENGTVYAFEASEAACLVVRENALLNGLGDVIQAVNSVLAERSGITVDFHWDFVSGRSSAVMEPPSGMSIPLKKASLSLDDFTAHSGAHPDLIKIDVEGAESRVIAGMLQVLTDDRPTVVVELHAWPDMSIQQNVDVILESIQNTRYTMVNARTKSEIEDGSEFADVRASTSSVESRSRVLLLPEEEDVPAWFKEFDTSSI